MTLLFAATYPERTAAAILFGTQPNFVPQTEQARDERLRAIAERERRWGANEYLDGLLDALAEPGPRRGTPSLVAAVRTDERESPRRRGSAADERRNRREPRPLRDPLPDPRAPPARRPRRRHCRRASDGRCDPEAEFVELEGEDHAWFVDPEQIAREVSRFLSGIWERGEWDLVDMDRVLATVLFTDIVGSTERAFELGDRQWREVLQHHHALIRRHLVRFRGSEMTRPGTASSPPSTGLCGRSAVRARSGTRCETWSGRAHRPPHGRVRSVGREGQWDRGSYRFTDCRGGRCARGAGLEHREGHRRRLGHRLPRARNGKVEGRPGRVAAIRGRAELALRESARPHARRARGPSGR
jgi:hypothetical protein